MTTAQCKQHAHAARAGASRECGQPWLKPALRRMRPPGLQGYARGQLVSLGPAQRGNALWARVAGHAAWFDSGSAAQWRARADSQLDAPNCVVLAVRCHDHADLPSRLQQLAPVHQGAPTAGAPRGDGPRRRVRLPGAARPSGPGDRAAGAGDGESAGRLRSPGGQLAGRVLRDLAGGNPRCARGAGEPCDHAAPWAARLSGTADATSIPASTLRADRAAPRRAAGLVGRASRRGRSATT